MIVRRFMVTLNYKSAFCQWVKTDSAAGLPVLWRSTGRRFQKLPQVVSVLRLRRMVRG